MVTIKGDDKQEEMGKSSPVDGVVLPGALITLSCWEPQRGGMG